MSDTQHDAGAPVALITGSSAGIGQSIAYTLAAAGYRLVVTSRALERATEASRVLNDQGFTAVPAAVDVSDPDQVEAMFDTLDREYGRLDVLVNNAGIASIGPSETFPLRRWNKILALNLTAPFQCSQLAAHRMDARGGVIVNIGSIYSTVSAPHRAAYVSSKHGLIGLTKALASEWAPKGIRVLAVCPSYVMTDLIQQAVDSGNFDETRILGRTPVGRLGTTAEVANVVRFLVSDDARYMTGSVVQVDGGWAGFGGA